MVVSRPGRSNRGPFCLFFIYVTHGFTPAVAQQNPDRPTLSESGYTI
jgi:hypothetical protein